MSYQWPERTHKHAPSFKKDVLYSLQLFFEELEKLFKARDVEMAKAPTSAAAMTDEEKIEKAVEYLDGETMFEWRELSVYAQKASKTWDQFKEAIYDQYPESDPKRSRRYTIGDMHSLIGKTVASGIYTVKELGEFARQYFAITNKLLDSKEIGNPEVLKGFINAFGSQEDVKRRIKQYLDKNTNLRNVITESTLKTAAIEALEGPSAVEEAFQPPGRAYPTTAKATEHAARSRRESQEQMFCHFENIMKSNSGPSVTAVNSALPQRSYNSSGGSYAYTPNPNCFYCGKEGCRMPRCEVLKRDLDRGYCSRNSETGHIQSPVGGPLSRYRGATLKERLEEYHRTNP
ncbi:hypothetical protein DL96DRAFT_1483574, partial [Flagelloscypha sp. PMI_526]